MSPVLALTPEAQVRRVNSGLERGGGVGVRGIFISWRKSLVLFVFKRQDGNRDGDRERERQIGLSDRQTELKDTQKGSISEDEP
jgi:hypothetical protein